MIVLDTTVLVYATGADHRFREPCRRLVRAVADDAVSATTSIEVIQEYAHVRARRRDRGDAVALANDMADLLAPLLVVEEPDLREGLALFERMPRLGSLDAVLAAAARSAGARALISADSAFADVPRLTHVVPDEQAVAALLE